jgi:hypothetical protein
MNYATTRASVRQVTEADWHTWARGSRCAELSKTLQSSCRAFQERLSMMTTSRMELSLVGRFILTVLIITYKNFNYKVFWFMLEVLCDLYICINNTYFASGRVAPSEMGIVP